MLTDEEIYQAVDSAPLAQGPQTFVIAIGRAIEAKVLARQEQLLREAQMAAAPHFVAASGMNAGNSAKECAPFDAAAAVKRAMHLANAVGAARARDESMVNPRTFKSPAAEEALREYLEKAFAEAVGSTKP